MYLLAIYHGIAAVAGSNGHHTSLVPPPQSVGITRLYLEGCNQLFERELVCHTKIRDKDSEVLKSIDKGYQFFLKWNEYLVKKCKYYCVNASWNYDSPNVL